MSGPDELLARLDAWNREFETPHVRCRGELSADPLLRDCRTRIAANAALAARCGELQAQLDAIDTPEILNFLLAVDREAKHQIKRWGYAHDRSKSAENWFWLVGYLAGKALRSAITGDRDKALHHTISSAAALANWHAAIIGDTSGAGVGQDDDLRATNPIDAQSDDAALASQAEGET